MQRKSLLLFIALLLVLALGVFASACASEETTTTAVGTETTAAPSGEPIKIGYDEGFTSFMAYDCELADKGLRTALAMLDNQFDGRPLEYYPEDNASDPVIAVDKARKLVESDGINVMIGPIFSPSAKAVTEYLATSSGIPQISIVGQPSENLETANGLAFIHTGFFDSHGYYFGKYLAELGYKTANVINYDDTPAYALTDGFRKAFVEEGGGEILSENYVPLDMVDFSAYLTTMPEADVTVHWIFGNGAVPFVQQYTDYGLKGRLATTMSNYYAYTLDNAQNDDFVAAYEQLYPGEKPTPQGYGAWQGVMMYIEALKATGGDTTPAKTIAAMSNMSIDSPAGKVQIVPYKDAFIAKRDFFMLEVQEVDGVLTWVPVKTYNQVLLGTLDDVGE
jgi:branched-chain amino acid transport system substrate-binding protein